jgi:hypothetical protein
MKKNYLVKKSAKKPVKKAAKKNAAQLREDKITKIRSMVSEICDYAIDNLCTEQAQFEELEWKLREYIK